MHNMLILTDGKRRHTGDCIAVDGKLHLQISVFRNTIGKKVAQRAICGVCSQVAWGELVAQLAGSPSLPVAQPTAI